ncbi:Imm7 family immunity protein [Hymenobacter rigui]|uniref:Uncharacterized protein n=1 Tax=Hymenobacter rigui TaxID=334424 RepID=A0A428KLX7_9BACT|nr:Imm7 family immunity protein [Hymenobacter rigui]RSK47401.1 hypothetical protein EI291_15940 [Hymenobacter rigui]
MIEAHGWITLKYSDYHSEDQSQNDFVYNFRSFLQQHYNWILQENMGRVVNRNGLVSFSIDVRHNHPGESFYPLEIFAWVAQHSTGSYGLLYVYDDEDSTNTFQVWVLKRGQLLKAPADPFLSPYHEEVEREYDENNPPLD